MEKEISADQIRELRSVLGLLMDFREYAYYLGDEAPFEMSDRVELAIDTMEEILANK